MMFQVLALDLRTCTNCGGRIDKDKKALTIT
jgi:hypothetical protein